MVDMVKRLIEIAACAVFILERVQAALFRRLRKTSVPFL
jgi:hypothetical protein